MLTSGFQKKLDQNLGFPHTFDDRPVLVPFESPSWGGCRGGNAPRKKMTAALIGVFVGRLNLLNTDMDVLESLAVLVEPAVDDGVDWERWIP